MAKETTYEEIARDLKNRVYKPVYYLMGEESYYIDRISDYIAQTVLTEEEREFNQTILCGVDTDVPSIINAAKRYPMMSEYQVVIVKEAQNVKKIEELSYYLQKPLMSTILVICHKNGVLDKRKKLAAEISKIGVLFDDIPPCSPDRRPGREGENVIKGLHISPVQKFITAALHVIRPGRPLGIDIKHDKTVVAVAFRNALHAFERRV